MISRRHVVFAAQTIFVHAQSPQRQDKHFGPRYFFSEQELQAYSYSHAADTSKNDFIVFCL